MYYLDYYYYLFLNDLLLHNFYLLNNHKRFHYYHLKLDLLQQELEKNDEGKMELEDEGAHFKTPISPFCDEIFYCYYGEEDATADDIKEWEIMDNLEENIQSGKYRIPDFIKLVFKWEEEELERTITLPIKLPKPA